MPNKLPERELAKAFDKYVNDIRFVPRLFGEYAAENDPSTMQATFGAFLGYVDVLADRYERGITTERERLACHIAKIFKDNISIEYGWPVELDKI